MTPKSPPEVEQIKPCPFCGGEGSAHNAFPLFDDPWIIAIAHGDDCPIMGWEGYCYPTKAEAVAAWNRRALANVTDEREKAIIAWLRGFEGDWRMAMPRTIADALERGEHRKGEG